MLNLCREDWDHGKEHEGSNADDNDAFASSGTMVVISALGSPPKFANEAGHNLIRVYR